LTTHWSYVVVFSARSSWQNSTQRRKVLLTFAIVGAGPTGVELAGHISELSHKALKRNFRAFDPARARVVLLDAVDTVLPTFPKSLQRRTRRDLERLGVEVRLRTRVTGVDADGLSVENSDGSTDRVEAATKIWAAGVRGSPLGAILSRQSDATVDRAGRVAVLPDLTIPGHPEVFVVGDLMSLDRLPGVAEVAMQSGHHAATTILRRVRGDTEQRAFRYHDLGTAATIARFRAVVYVGRIRLSGLIGWLVWLLVHLTFLTGFKNRFATIGTWTLAFLARGRPERTLTRQESVALARALQPRATNKEPEDGRSSASPRAA
jgi:NADH:ubiquinone reductase (H+-translocating)